MGVKKISPKNDFEDFTNNMYQTVILRCLKAFTYVGETCLREARIGGSYTDRTGNLRNSIGYVVLIDGKVYSQSTYLKSNEGSVKSQELLRKLQSQYTKGIVIIMVAGMNYAAYVEAKGYNVLTSAELLAESLVPIIMKRLGFEKK